jgi:integrase
MQARREQARVCCSGHVEERRSRRGEVVFTLHVRVAGRRPRLTLGTAREGWTREAAEEKLRDTLGALRAGVPLETLFPPDEPVDSTPSEEPTLGEVMDDYLADRRGSVSRRTLEADRWAIGHLRPFWADRTPSAVTTELVDRFRRKTIAEADAVRERIVAGECPLEERAYRRRSDGALVNRKQPRKPLSPRSINTLIQMLATLLDVAMERSDVDLAVNAARGRRRKVKVVQPKLRSFLEVDQVWALLDAAALRQRRITSCRGYVYPGRVILSLLTLGGLRISELCSLERGLVNLGVDVIHTSRSKTAAGYREIDVIFAALHQDLAEHLARRTTFGRSRDPLVPSGNGNRLVASNIRQRVLAKVIAEANELLRERGVPEIVECTPHTLRRTYISLLLAAGCDPAYVQQQVGHTDPTLTLRIYQQLLKRKRREEYRSRVNELLGTSPAALSKRPDVAEQDESGPNSGPNSLFLAV